MFNARGLSSSVKAMNQPHLGVLDFDPHKIPYILYRSVKRKRTLEMQVIHPQGLKVTAPKRWGILAIEKLLEEKKSWIIKEWLAQAENTIHYPFNWEFGERISYLGEEYFLHLFHNTPKATCDFNKPFFTVSLSQKHCQAKSLAEKWLRNEAKKLLQARCEFFAKEMNLVYQKVSIGNQKERWGSCSENGDIRLNWRLILLPLALIDYVVIHELAHLVHLNHQPAFWQVVEKYAPDYKNQRKTLRQIAIGRFG
jgi:predicted metal-dependent hydrolase